MNDGSKPQDTADKSLGDIVSEVSEKASLLVREEIELAKAEIKDKVSKLGRGAGVGVAAGVFLLFAFFMFLHALAWFINDLLDVQTAIWAGFAIVTGLLILFAALAGWLALRWLKKGAPPTPGPGNRGGQAHPGRARAPGSPARAHGQDPGQGSRLMSAEARSPAEIRTQIEETRRELAFSVNDLRSKVTELTNWRGQLSRNRQTALVGAAVAGFVIGGGVAATVSLLRRRRR